MIRNKNSSVCAIIATYNGEKYISKCLKSLLNSSHSLTIYVVDNGSTDDTLSILKSFEEVHLIQNSENLGFGKANNLALKKAYSEGFEYFFLVNQDTRIKEDTVEELVRLSRKFNDNAIVSPVHFDDSEERLDLQFTKFFKKDCKDHKLFREDFESGNLKESYEVEFVNAALWMLSREVLETVGIFHPYFFHYGEDVNYKDRAIYKGAKLVVAGRLNAVHNKTYGKKKPLEPALYFEKEMLKLMLDPLKKKGLLHIFLKCISGSTYFFKNKKFKELPQYFLGCLRTYLKFKKKLKTETVSLNINN